MKRETREAILKTGRRLANAAYALGRNHKAVDDSVRKTLRELADDWDAAHAAYRSETANARQKGRKR